MITDIDEVKKHLRVDYTDEDDNIQTYINGAEELVEKTLRRPMSVTDTEKIAVLYAVNYLFEHRENPDLKELTGMLRILLSSDREEVF